MNRPKKLTRNLLLLMLYAAVLAVWYFLDLPCIPRRITGIPCPTCGMTRAWLAAFRLDFAAAFSQHPMFWSIPVLGLYLLFGGKLFSSAKVNAWVLGMILAGLFFVWITRIFGFLGVLLPL